VWLADAVLAHRRQWPAPAPLIAGQIRGGDLRATARQDADGWGQTTWMLARVRAAAAAADLSAALVRRAQHLLAVAPKLLGHDAARRVEMLLTVDRRRAPAPRPTAAAAGCRPFGGGAARELTGRPPFRLYGL
jgi:Protein of unknown function (DUF1403)